MMGLDAPTTISLRFSIVRRRLGHTCLRVAGGAGWPAPAGRAERMGGRRRLEFVAGMKIW